MPPRVATSILFNPFKTSINPSYQLSHTFGKINILVCFQKTIIFLVTIADLCYSYQSLVLYTYLYVSTAIYLLIWLFLTSLYIATYSITNKFYLLPLRWQPFLIVSDYLIVSYKLLYWTTIIYFHTLYVQVNLLPPQLTQSPLKSLLKVIRLR